MIEKLSNLTVSVLDVIIGLGGFVLLYYLKQFLFDKTTEFAFRLMQNKFGNKLQSENEDDFYDDFYGDIDDCFEEVDENTLPPLRDGELVVIKTCPMCGKNIADVITTDIEDGCHWYYVTCNTNNGGCGLSTAAFKSPKDALIAWNIRKGLMNVE